MFSHTRFQVVGRPSRSSLIRLLAAAVVVTHAAGAVTPLAAQAATPIRHPAGYALTLPSGWSVESLDDAQLLLRAPNARDGEAFVWLVTPAGGVASAADEEGIRQSEAQILEQFPELRRVGAPRVVNTALGRGIRLDFENLPGAEPTRLSLYAVIRDDQTVTLLAGGPRAMVERRRSAVDAAFASLRPDAAP
jgi:hypothetical protein